VLSPTGLWNSNAVRKIDLKKPNIPVKTSWRGGDSPPAERGGTYPTKGWCGGSSATQVGEGRQWDFLYSSSQELYFLVIFFFYHWSAYVNGNEKSWQKSLAKMWQPIFARKQAPVGNSQGVIIQLEAES